MLTTRIETYTGGLFSTNAHLVKIGEQSLLFDAPAGSLVWLKELGITPDALFLTHQHFDHVEDAHQFTCPIYSYEDYDPELIMDARARAWGLPISVKKFRVSHCLAGVESLKVGKVSLSLLHVPGHSPDSLVFHLKNANIAFVGDTLFRQGVGRTDLPGGDHTSLITGIREKLLSLPPHTRLLPGHGVETTPALEQNNPFLL